MHFFSSKISEKKGENEIFWKKIQLYVSWLALTHVYTEYGQKIPKGVDFQISRVEPINNITILHGIVFLRNFQL